MNSFHFYVSFSKKLIQLVESVAIITKSKCYSIQNERSHTQTCSYRLMLFTIKSAHNNPFYNAIKCHALSSIIKLSFNNVVKKQYFNMSDRLLYSLKL